MDASSGPPESIRPQDAIKTYRYLRIGMIGAVAFLATSILIEKAGLDCWQTSISAYYYTPVRAVFVGTMMAVALVLVAYKGRDAWEDSLLNAAGMFAPVVAIAPTTNVDVASGCWSVPPDASPKVDGELAPWVTKIVDNNFDALLILGCIAFAAAIVIEVFVERRHPSFGESSIGRRISIGFAGAMLLLFWRLSDTWGAFYEKAHGYAAVAFFAFLILAIIANAARHFFEYDNRWAGIYGAVALAMTAVGIVVPAVRIGGEHWLLWLEGLEIALFATYWVAQTVENWDETVVRSSTVGGVGSRWWAIQTHGELAWRDRVALLLGQMLPALAQDLLDQVLGRKPVVAAGQSSSNPSRRAAYEPRNQDTPLAREAQRLCRAASGDDDWLYNHCRRTFELGDLLSLRSPSLTVDLEILYAAALLHDIGLSADVPANAQAPGIGASLLPIDSPCFAVRGAAVAQWLAARHYWTESRTDRLVEAISLHLNVRVPIRRGTEAHLLNVASAYDTIRFDSGRVRHEGRAIAQIETRWPRTSVFCPSLGHAWERASEPRTRAEFLTERGDFQDRLMKTCRAERAG